MECYRLHEPCAILVSQNELPLENIWMLQPIGAQQTKAHILRAQSLWSAAVSKMDDVNFHVYKFMADPAVPLNIRHNLGELIVRLDEGAIAPRPSVEQVLDRAWRRFEAAGNSVVYLPEDSVFRIDRQVFNSDTPWLQISILRGPCEAAMGEVGAHRLHLPLIDFARMDYSPQFH